MRSGTSSATERASIRTNAAIEATEAAIKAIVCSPVQPTSGASETAYVTKERNPLPYVLGLGLDRVRVAAARRRS
jgi:hypothetical protein